VVLGGAVQLISAGDEVVALKARQELRRTAFGYGNGIGFGGSFCRSTPGRRATDTRRGQLPLDGAGTYPISIGYIGRRRDMSAL